MGRFTVFAKQIVDKHLDGHPWERAFSKSKTPPFQAIVEYDKRIDEIIERFDGKPPDEWQRHIGELITRKGEERELIEEIEILEKQGYRK